MTALDTTLIDALKASTPAAKSELRDIVWGMCTVLRLSAQEVGATDNPERLEKHHEYTEALKYVLTTLFSKEEQARITGFGMRSRDCIRSALSRSIISALSDAQLADATAHIPKATIKQIKNDLVALTNALPPQYRTSLLGLTVRLDNISR